MVNITEGSVLSAVVRVNNYTDADKKYDIVGDVSVVNNGEYGDGQIQNGSVSLDGSTLATWSYYGNLGISYQIADAGVQKEILTEVQQFIGAVMVFKENVNVSAEV